jgi:hypothetical protein
MEKIPERLIPSASWRTKFQVSDCQLPTTNLLSRFLSLIPEDIHFFKRHLVQGFA